MRDDLNDRDDEELVRLVRQGDQSAARVLFGRHESQLGELARRRVVGGLRRKLGASDVVQETFLAAIQDLDGFEDRGPGSFRAWLERILDCRAADQFKHHVRGKRSLRREQSRASGVLREVPAELATPSAVAAHREEFETYARVLGEMNEDDRRVIELVRDHGKDFGVVGAAMSRSPDAARKLYARAVVRLGMRVRRSP